MTGVLKQGMRTQTHTEQRPTKVQEELAICKPRREA